VDEAELALRQEIFTAFATTGAPPPLAAADHETRARLRALADRHVVVLDGDHVVMAHPFAGHTSGTRVRSGDRTWWGNCVWDGLGIVAALDLHEAELTSGGLTVTVRDGDVVDDGSVVFQVAVPARHWWDDIGFT
jgi:hypothetical protein